MHRVSFTSTISPNVFLRTTARRRIVMSSSSSSNMPNTESLCEWGSSCRICIDESSTFRKAVYHAVARIPAGEVWTYGAVAKAVGNARASRAVGNALKANEYNSVEAHPRVPCHRVVAQKGLLGGFYGREKINEKVKLLQGEGVKINDGIVESCFVKDR